MRIRSQPSTWLRRAAALAGVVFLLAAPADATEKNQFAKVFVGSVDNLSIARKSGTFLLVNGRSGSKFESIDPISGNPHGDIDIACEACHTPDGWSPLRDTLNFNHTLDTRFAMTGRHQQAECRSCHHDLRFDRPDLEPNACASCHLDVHQAQLGNSCQDCHTTQDFHIVKGQEIHAATSFPLTGSHIQISCESCHTDEFDGAFASLDPSCISCHEADYEATAQGVVNHVAAGFPTTCDACHNTLAFSGATVFDHAEVAEGFGLVGAHISLDCSACHNPGNLEPLFDPADQNDCFTCHEGDYNETATTSIVDHAASNLPTDCLQCHTVDSWQGALFDHPTVANGFALVGAHMNLDCASCHSNPDFSVPYDPASQNDCFACHQDEHQDEHPDFPTTCLDCHTTDSWDADAFDHSVTGFALVGSHIGLDCSACHAGPDNAPIWIPSSQDDCFACHQDEHQDEHPDFPTTCLDCHTTDSWDADAFDHSLTGFALVGSHISLDCSACHAGPDNAPIWIPSSQDDCLTCHEADHEDEHPDFPTTCLDCHTTDSWEDAQFDHSSTGFSLLGAHLPLDCSSCHVGPDFGLIWTPSSQDDCLTCHEEEHQDEHPDFPTTCLDCHTTDSWEDAQFDHGTATGFPLVGAHLPLDCSSCHLLPGFELIWEPASADDCFTCHDQDHQKAHPDFPTTCLDCHMADAWEDAQFDHGSATGFPLVGAHLPLDCASCHLLPSFDLIWTPAGPNDCFTCHEDDHQDEHPGFPTTCLDCHTTDSWEDAQFDHGSATGFPLIGAHLPLDCSSCHLLPGFELIWEPSSADDCFTCHDLDHQKAHPGFPTTCLDCHTADSWDADAFDHGATTGFPLLGAHFPLDCSSCHLLPGFELIWEPASANDCFTCHEEDHQDEHPDFPTTCLDCHTTDSWEDAQFDHGSATGFPLVGAHLPLDCASCHLLPSFDLIWTPAGPNDCFTCHEDDANQAHSGFPPTCLDCHTTDSWASTFNHDPIFPIYSGRHESEWASCQTCHTNPGNFMIFSCFTCHEHNQQDMDDKHDEVAGYVYESNACYSCHPDGEADDIRRVR